MINKTLSALGLIKRAGKLVLGFDGATECMREKSKEEKLAIISCDASEKTAKRFKDKAATYGVRIEELSFTGREIGEAVGKGPCACGVICGNNFINMLKQAIIKTAEENECRKKD